MTLKEYRSYFKSKLQSIYPEEEIGSFFYIFTEKFLKLKRVEVALELERKLTSEEISFFENALQKLENEEPVQYIVGETEFFGLPFKVNRSVLIPRPETEELVDWVIKDYTETNQGIRILDIGTGSGCIAVSLAKKIPNSIIKAMDISAKAINVAKENAGMNQVYVSFIEEDVLSLKRLDSTYDIIVSNPPYVRVLEKERMAANVLQYEPENALFVSDEDPLLFYSKIADLARESLNSSGSLYFEINEAYGDKVVKMLAEKGFEDIVVKKDFFGKDRMVKGTKAKYH